MCTTQEKISLEIEERDVYRVPSEEDSRSQIPQQSRSPQSYSGRSRSYSPPQPCLQDSRSTSRTASPHRPTQEIITDIERVRENLRDVTSRLEQSASPRPGPSHGGHPSSSGRSRSHSPQCRCSPQSSRGSLRSHSPHRRPSPQRSRSSSRASSPQRPTQEIITDIERVRENLRDVKARLEMRISPSMPGPSHTGCPTHSPHSHSHASPSPAEYYTPRPCPTYEPKGYPATGSSTSGYYSASQLDSSQSVFPPTPARSQASVSQVSFSSPASTCYYSPPQAISPGLLRPVPLRTSSPSPRRHIRTPSPLPTPSPQHYRRHSPASPRVLFPSPSPRNLSSPSSYSPSCPSSPPQSPDSTYPSPPRQPHVCHRPGEATPPPPTPPTRRRARVRPRAPETTPPSRMYGARRSPGASPPPRYVPRRLASPEYQMPDSTTAPLPPRQVPYREPPGEAMARPSNPNFIRRVVSLRRRLQIMHRNLPRH